MAFNIEQFGKDYKPHREVSFFTIGTVSLVPVTHLEKGKSCQIYWYCVRDFRERWWVFDVRELPNFEIEVYDKIPFWIYRRDFVAKYLNSQKMTDFSFFKFSKFVIPDAIKNKATRIRNGKYMYRGFVLEKALNKQEWTASNTHETVGPCYSFERLKFQVDRFLMNIQ